MSEEKPTKGMFWISTSGHTLYYRNYLKHWHMDENGVLQYLPPEEICHSVDIENISTHCGLKLWPRRVLTGRFREEFPPYHRLCKNCEDALDRREVSK